jgi:hypothetical protein
MAEMGAILSFEGLPQTSAPHPMRAFQLTQFPRTTQLGALRRREPSE